MTLKKRNRRFRKSSRSKRAKSAKLTNLRSSTMSLKGNKQRRHKLILRGLRLSIKHLRKLFLQFSKSAKLLRRKAKTLFLTRLKASLSLRKAARLTGYTLSREIDLGLPKFTTAGRFDKYQDSRNRSRF